MKEAYCKDLQEQGQYQQHYEHNIPDYQDKHGSSTVVNYDGENSNDEAKSVQSANTGGTETEMIQDLVVNKCMDKGTHKTEREHSIKYVDETKNKDYSQPSCEKESDIPDDDVSEQVDVLQSAYTDKVPHQPTSETEDCVTKTNDMPETKVAKDEPSNSEKANRQDDKYAAPENKLVEDCVKIGDPEKAEKSQNQSSSKLKENTAGKVSAVKYDTQL